MPKLKRKLTDLEIKQIRHWMEDAPQGRKPTIRQIAKAFKVNRPSVVKSLGGSWDTFIHGVQKPARPVLAPPKIVTNKDQAHGSIEPFTTDLGTDPLS